MTKRKRMDYIWKRFQAGESVEEIASSMGFYNATILRYLEDAYSEGRSLRVDGLIEMSALSEEAWEQVVDAFEEFGINRLKPIFDALDRKVAYDELHIWRLIY